MVDEQIPHDELPSAIGREVKSLRTALGLSGRQVAAAAGVSQPFLSQLESGRSSVAISTLYRIADALGVNPADLLPAPPGDEIEVLRAPEIHRMPVSELPHSSTSSTIFRSGKLIAELSDFLIEPGEYVEEWFQSGAEHVVYAIEGSIRIEFDGHDDVILAAGDVVFHPADIRSRWHLQGDSRARIILVAATQALNGNQNKNKEERS